MIIQSSAQNGLNDISFTVSRSDLKRALLSLESLRKKLKAQSVHSDDSVAKLSIVGVGMRSHPGVAAKLFATLADNGINIEMISTSEIKVSCVVKQSDGARAVSPLLHKAFGLEKTAHMSVAFPPRRSAGGKRSGPLRQRPFEPLNFSTPRCAMERRAKAFPFPSTTS